MSGKIKIGICGYGNLGRGAESEIGKNPDMELAAVFTRRKPAGSLSIQAGVPVVHVDSAAEWKDRIDVMLLCGGSAKDLPEQGPEFAKLFNTVDSFDTHAKIPDYLTAMDSAARSGGKLAVISAGWDPGLFSLMRLTMGAVIPAGKTYSFWGPGVSQGHSGAIRGIDGVLGAVQYSQPVSSVMERIRNGEMPELSPREKHKRLCYVAAAEGADKTRIEKEIKEMPYYFDEYDTTVYYITIDQLEAEHGKLPHGGNLIHTGETGGKNSQVLELSLKLDSNPEFTASILFAYARAAYRLSAKGERGARTVFDIPPGLLSVLDHESVIKNLL
jgi:diaminopimelate dehydrogenase